MLRICAWSALASEMDVLVEPKAGTEGPLGVPEGAGSSLNPGWNARRTRACVIHSQLELPHYQPLIGVGSDLCKFLKIVAAMRTSNTS